MNSTVLCVTSLVAPSRTRSETLNGGSSGDNGSCPTRWLATVDLPAPLLPSKRTHLFRTILPAIIQAAWEDERWEALQKVCQIRIVLEATPFAESSRVWFARLSVIMNMVCVYGGRSQLTASCELQYSCIESQCNC